MKRIGIYGGIFNPPHVGHMGVVRSALEKLKLQEVLVIPANCHPGKAENASMPAPEQRLEMTRRAMGEIPGVTVSDLEICRGGVSYTDETVAELKKQYPGDELVLILGSDKFLSFTQWRNWEEILKNATLAVFYRGGKHEQTAVEEQKTVVETAGGKVILADNPVTRISSTDVRRLITFCAAGEVIPEPIKQYILDNDLYGSNEYLMNLTPEQLELKVISLLKPNRVRHVLGCRDTAVALARHWGADETDALRAGLLHDVTKALDGELQLTLCRAHGIVLDDFSRKNPKILHALTGSVVAERIFCERNAVVGAIESHTTGKKDMTLLEKIIYVADYMEPNRNFDGVEKMRQLAFSNIDEALKMGLEMTIQVLKEQGREISGRSNDALNWLKNK